MIRVLFLIIFLILGCTHSLSALEITFKLEGSVDGSVIKLGDIADFDEESEMSQALATQLVGQAPSPGENVNLRSLSIKKQLESTQALPRTTIWRGSPTVTVYRRGISVGPDQVQTIIAEYINKNRNNLPEAQVRFIPKALPLPFVLPIGNMSHEVIPSDPGILGSSRFSIIFRVNDKVIKNMSVRGKVEALAKVVVATKPLKKGRIIKPQMLALAIMDISKINDPGFSLDDFIGKKLQRSLRAGTPVRTSMVEALPIVRRGERVKIVISSGSMLLTASGLAYSDGKLDQMIQVQNINSHKVIYGRVAAPGIVEVIL